LQHARQLALIILWSSLVATACGQQQTAAPAAAGAAQPPAADLDTRLAAADLDKGRRLFLQCRACHSLEEGGANKVGPNLWGMFGRKAGLAPGFSYSEAVSKASIVWSPVTLDTWLARPSEFLPGNRMVYAGMPDPADRASLIAYVLRETSPAVPPQADRASKAD
jgi:cytochrome c